MNILDYLFAETVKTDSTSETADSVFHAVTLDSTVGISRNMVGSRDAYATENAFVRSAFQLDNEINTHNVGRIATMQSVH